METITEVLEEKVGKRFTILLLGLVCLWACSAEHIEEADMVIFNANIYTVNPSTPKAEAVAIKADSILFVGSSTAAQAYVGKQTQLLDLGGKTVTPGLIESHAHFLGIGYQLMNVDLSQTKSYEEVIAKVVQATKQAEAGSWILGRGWHQSKWNTLPTDTVKGFQTHKKLSEISPDNPVFLKHASGHAAFVNQKAMEIAGLARLSPENISSDIAAAGGEIIRDKNGNPTGIFNERAMALVSKYIPKNDRKSHEKAMALAFDACLRNGITSFHDAGSDSLALAVKFSYAQENKMRTRLYVMLSSHNQNLLDAWYAMGPQINVGGNNVLTVRAIKVYADGALGSRGAWLLADYTDRKGHTGHETTPTAHMRKIIFSGTKHGFQMCTHAIGDRANREVLDLYAAAFQAFPERAVDARFRIEHAQHISAEDIPRFGKMDIIAAMQAIHMSSDRPWAVDRLGKARIEEGAYVWRKLLDTGAKIVNGTDAPVEPLSAIASFYAAVSRKTLDGEPENGYEPSQKMSREEALRSYTIDAAYGAFEENIKGSIAVGKLADLTVFSQDIMQIDEDKLLATTIEYTILGGKVLYQRQ